MLDQGLGSWPRRRARISPHRTALVYEGRAWSYAQVHERVTRLAHVLRGLGVGPGDRIGYLGRNHPALAETLFAAGAVGAVLVPLNFRLTAPELAFMLRDSGARVLVWGPELAGTVAELRDTACVDRYVEVGTDLESLLAGAPTDPLDEPVTLDQPCMIQYTSGTSGRPKGVVLTHGNITWNAYNILIDVDLASDEVALLVAPLFHTGALNQILLPTFLKGGASVLMPAFDADRVLELIAEHRVTFTFCVPAMFQAIAQSPRWPAADLSSMRTLMCAGAPVPEPLIRTYQQRGLTFLQGYGLTETAPGALLLRAGESTSKVGSTGTPCFFTDVRVVRPDQTDVAVGETGEVIIRGPNVMRGYWHRPEETEAAFYPGDWFRSGDGAQVDADGYVYIADRIKDMIISGGENIYPAEVESVLFGHPAVADCAVIGVPDRKWGEVGRAVVVLRAGAAATAEEIVAHLAGKLAGYKIPRSVVFAEALPRTGSGKVLKRRLRESYGSSTGPAGPPSTGEPAPAKGASTWT
ncbi:MAG TPA: long-chain fatty acid--CoA ligase [Mycobacteriales bacterium]|nr:long-chain fatty acid--CoA ligase [Mycobacteriales bacterium]